MPNTTYRAKGLCFLSEYPEQRCLLERAGSRLELTCLDRWGERPAATRLVLIGCCEAIHPARLQALFDSAIGTVRERSGLRLIAANQPAYSVLLRYSHALLARESP